MRIIVLIIRLLAVILFIVCQQGFLIALGALVYIEHSEGFGFLIWLLCLPMLYVNYLTFKKVMKHGLINFITINADTSEIDVPQGTRWYDD